MVALPRLQRSLSVVNPDRTPTNAFQVWWDQFANAIIAAFAGVQSQLDTITAILDPNTLTPDKKPVWIFMNSYLTGEQADLDAKATTYGITTEKTNYDSAMTALASYLATLTTPVLWNDTSGNTTINDVTFRGKFTDVLTKKQFLINKITDKAKVLADAAQTSANTADTHATAAQGTANTAVTNAATAQTTANTANTTAGTAITNAATAQTTANTANTTANTANTTATAVKKTDKISASWSEPGAVLSATDAGTDSTITVAAHTRHWGDGTTTSVASHTFTGKAYSTPYFVYYDDPTQSDTTPSYQITTNGNTAAHNSSANRVGLGPITTPAAGAPDTDGGGTPPGGGYKIFDV